MGIASNENVGIVGRDKKSGRLPSSPPPTPFICNSSTLLVSLPANHAVSQLALSIKLLGQLDLLSRLFGVLSGKLAASFAQMIIGSNWLNNPGIGMFLGSSTYPVPPQAACPLSMLLGSLPYHTCCWAACSVANHILKLYACYYFI